MPTPATLPELIQPFVGARLNPVRDPAAKYGGYLPRAAAIDIITPGVERYDADVRGLTADGIELCRGGMNDFVAWSDVRMVRVAGMDADGNRTAVTEYHQPALDAVADFAMGRAA